MKINVIIVIAALVIIALLIPYLILVNKKNMAKMGDCLLKLPAKKGLVWLLVDVVAVALLVVCIFRNFGLMTLVLAACSVLGFYMMTRDGLNQKKYGVYKNGIICGNALVYYDDIMGFPVFELPAEEQEHYARNTLVIVSKQKGQIELVFEDEEQTVQVIDTLKELKIINY